MSEGGMTLAEVVQRLDDYDDELTIWARARSDLVDLTPKAEAVVAPRLPDDGVWWEEHGLSYVLEVDLAKEVIEVWRQDHGGVEPSAAQRCAAVIRYAVNDYYLEVDDDPGGGSEGGGSSTSGLRQ